MAEKQNNHLLDKETMKQVDKEWENIVLFNSILDAVKDFSENQYEKLKEAIASGDEDIIRDLHEKMNVSPLFNGTLLNSVVIFNPASKDYAAHDTNSTGSAGAAQGVIIGDALVRKDIKGAVNYLKLIKRSLSRFIFAIEDVALRALDPVKIESKNYHPLNLEVVQEAFITLKASNAVQGRLKNILTVPTHLPELAEDEVVDKINPGALINGLFNILRNACEFGVEANKVELTMEREGDELVIRVENDGVKNLQSEQLNSTSDKFIFTQGVTTGEIDSEHRGIGLANMDKRFSSMGVELSVVSSKDDQTSFYSTNPDRQAEEVSQTFAAEPNTTDTVFEIRLPITKKEK